MDLPLNPSPGPEWDERYSELMESPFLRRKYNRESRIAEHLKYIDSYLPELRDPEHRGALVDIGPGPGELLEIGRELGRDVLGIDAHTGEGGMGNEYLELSRLMTTRQKIHVDYDGLVNWMRFDNPLLNSACGIVNSRGSIEQALSGRMVGIPHDKHQCCRKLRWKEDGKTLDLFEAVMTRIWKLLLPGGILLIHANGSACDDWYDENIQYAADQAGLALVKRWDKRLHKWVK